MTLDFTSCAYLGMDHAADDLPRWRAIADARPAALAEPDVLRRVGEGVAALQGEEDGVAGPSSLALAMDAVGPALRGDWRVIVDAGCYPVLRWAARQRGAPPVTIAHHRPSALRQALAAMATGQPILLVDGYCVGCGRAAPLACYATLIAARGGRLLVDDTQALGLFGQGGAGTGVKGVRPGVVLRLASLAKAFNAPLAVLSGSRADIARFREHSFTRVYCGPPSIPVALAAEQALRLNAAIGGALRARLRRRVRTFRAVCAARGVPLAPGLFPVQKILGDGVPAAKLVAVLAGRGLSAFASRTAHDRVPRLSLIVTAAHREDEVERAGRLLAAALPAAKLRTPRECHVL